MTVLIDGCHVDFWMELFVGQCQDICLASLRLYSQIEVAGIVPTTDVYTRHLLTFFKFTKTRTLIVTVDMIAYTGHQCIIHVAGIMPDAVLLCYSHVTHLNGQEILYYRLPDTTLIDIVGYTEHTRPTTAVAYLIKPGFRHVAEVGNEVAIAQELSPYLWCGCAYHLLAVGIDADQLYIAHSGFTIVGLDDDTFGLLSQVAHL